MMIFLIKKTPLVSSIKKITTTLASVEVWSSNIVPRLEPALWNVYPY